MATTRRTHSFRCTDEAWNAAAERARAEGRTVSDVINAYLHRYGKLPGPPPSSGRDPNREATS